MIGLLLAVLGILVIYISCREGAKRGAGSPPYELFFNTASLGIYIILIGIIFFFFT